MNSTIPRALLSLAHPIIVNPALEVEWEEKPVHLPPFSDINLNWQGFTLSHLHWVGIHEAIIEAEEWELYLIATHEGYHKSLANTPFSRHKKYQTLLLYKNINETFGDGRGEVEVPLDPYKSRNELEHKLGSVVCAIWESQLVEEVYAVRSSLLDTQKKFEMSHDLRRRLEKSYKEKYGKTIQFFQGIYDAFDFVAGKVGGVAATCLILNVMAAYNPQQAFIDIISYLLKNSSDNGYCSIADLSLEDAYIFFVVCFDRLDPDDSVYKRGGLTKLLESVDKNVNSVEEKGEFTEFLFSKPNAILCTKYNSHGIQPFLKAIRNGPFETQEVMSGNEAIVLEAILQQLIKGKGLLCPFWNPSHGCCSRKNRALLEKVWSCTKPDASCDWKQMGCLAKGAIV